MTSLSHCIELAVKDFEYRDVDYIGAPAGWLEAKLQNRFEEGYRIWRDVERLSWRGIIRS